MQWMARVEAEGKSLAEEWATEELGSPPRGFAFYATHAMPMHDKDVAGGGGYAGNPYRSWRRDLEKVLGEAVGRAKAARPLPRPARAFGRGHRHRDRAGDPLGRRLDAPVGDAPGLRPIGARPQGGDHLRAHQGIAASRRPVFDRRQRGRPVPRDQGGRRRLPDPGRRGRPEPHGRPGPGDAQDPGAIGGDPQGGVGIQAKASGAIFYAIDAADFADAEPLLEPSDRPIPGSHAPGFPGTRSRITTRSGGSRIRRLPSRHSIPRPRTCRPVQRTPQADVQTTPKPAPAKTKDVDLALRVLFMGRAGAVLEMTRDGGDDEALRAAVEADLNPAGSGTRPFPLLLVGVRHPGPGGDRILVRDDRARGPGDAQRPGAGEAGPAGARDPERRRQPAPGQAARRKPRATAAAEGGGE